MDSEFTVDLEQLDGIVSRLHGLAGYIEDQLRELDQRVAAVHDGSWSGTAAAAHAEAHKRWSNGAAEFHAGVKDLQTAAKQAHGHYSAAASANQDILRAAG